MNGRETSSTPTTSMTARRAGRRWAAAAAGLLAAGALAAAAPSAVAAPARAASSSTSACTTAQLAARVVPGDPGAGQRHAVVVLTNASRTSCSVKGYGGLALLGAPGQGVPTDLRREATPAPTAVRLTPGASAHSVLSWGAVPADDETGTACEPTATTVVVTPPGQRTAALVSWPGGPVCQHGVIHQQAYAAGATA